MNIQDILNGKYEEPKMFQITDVITEEVIEALTSGLNSKDELI